MGQPLMIRQIPMSIAKPTEIATVRRKPKI
jgi:hypothetical protein